MRLGEIERGDSVGTRALIGFISLVSGMRLPDAARVAFYHKGFVGGTLGHWTQAAMRGPSAWSIPERELMASSVAKWNSCPFCIGAHRAVAIKGMARETADAALADYRTAPIAPRLRSALALLEEMTLRPEALTPVVGTLLSEGMPYADIEDALGVGAVFNIIARYANALGFAVPSEAEFDKAADMLLKRGYGR
jgi:AhpD family alkylhydroperoxidase